MYAKSSKEQDKLEKNTKFGQWNVCGHSTLHHKKVLRVSNYFVLYVPIGPLSTRFNVRSQYLPS